MFEYILALIGGIFIGNALTEHKETDEKDYEYKPLKLEDGGGISYARKILQELGGVNKLVAMTGAYDFRDTGNGLSFRIKNQRANYIKITDSNHFSLAFDYYDVEIGRVRGKTYKVVAKQDDITFEELIQFIEKNTGMYLTFADGGSIGDSKGYVIYFGIFRGGRLTPIITEYYENLSDAEKSLELKKANKEKGWKLKQIDKMPIYSEVRINTNNTDYKKVKEIIHSEKKVNEFFKNKDSFYKKNYYWVKPQGYEWENWELKKMADGGNVKGEKYMHIYKLKYPNYNKIYVLEDVYMSPYDAMKKMGINLYPNYGTWATSYKYSGLSSHSDKYKKWHQLKKKGLSDEEIYNKIIDVKMADGGDVEEDMSVQFSDYKGKMIMFEPYFKKYYSNDIEFDNLEEAKKYIDSGSKTPSWQKEAYRREIMAIGGKVKFKDKAKAVAKKLEGTKVPKKYKKDYGKTYDRQEAEEASKKIIGAQVKKYGE